MIDKIIESAFIRKLNDNKEFYLYVLKCESNKYYVGKTIDLKLRLEYHIIKQNCRWTKQFKPISLKKIIVSNDSLDEDKLVKKYMIKKGIYNVRGGSYCQLKLTKTQIQAIIYEIIHSRGQCYYCLGDNHFINVNFYYIKNLFFQFYNFLFLIFFRILFSRIPLGCIF